MKEIICPVDFSPISRNALMYAASVAVKLKAQLTVLHAYELPVLYGDAPFLAVQQLGSEIEFSASKNLAEETEAVSAKFPGLVTEQILVCGIPSSEIVKASDSRNADLIIMGTKGLSGMERLFIGSTSERVFHHTSVPVLCIPDAAQFNGIHKIVFATDLKEDNLDAALQIADFARFFGAELQFVYVDTDNENLHSEKSEELTEKIRSHISYPKMSGFVSEDYNVSSGLKTFLDKFPADILAMFTHQRSFPRSLTSPSVTSRTLHHLETPLLVLNQK